MAPRGGDGVVRAVVGIGASAGGFEPLLTVAGGLPADLPAAVLVVVHLPATRESLLVPLLARVCRLEVVGAEDGQRLAPGGVYVAGPDRHLLVQRDRVRVVAGPKENGHRPAVDPLFRSIARDWGAASAAVVLSGALSDGAAGMAAIADAGGLTVVQDPTDAAVASMPQSAVHAVAVDAVVPASEIAALLVERIGAIGAADPEGVDADELELLGDGAREEGPTTFVCPDCGGVLNRLAEDRVLAFRCQVGHRWSGDDLRASLHGKVEDAIWVALRVLDEQIHLDEQLLHRARATGRSHAATAIEQRLAERRAAAEPLWRLVTS